MHRAVPRRHTGAVVVKLHILTLGTESLSKGKDFHVVCGGDMIKLNAATEILTQRIRKF